MQRKRWATKSPNMMERIRPNPLVSSGVRWHRARCEFVRVRGRNMFSTRLAHGECYFGASPAIVPMSTLFVASEINKSKRLKSSWRQKRGESGFARRYLMLGYVVMLLLMPTMSNRMLAAQTIPTRVPERVCLAENYTSTASTCTLPTGVSAGDGLVVVGTNPSTPAADLSQALHDSRGNGYIQLESEVYSGNQSGSIYLWYSRVATPLIAGDTITLTPLPSLGSWNFSVYDIGPVQTNPADVGVVFSNANVGTAGTVNPATGVDGWWTGQTAPTKGAQDLCLAAMTVNSSGGGGSPSPITSFSMDNSFHGLDIVNFHAQAAPTPGIPNYSGASLMTMYVEVPAGTAVQSHVITAVVPDQAASAMYCFQESSGATASFPYFTGNYCAGATSCTLSNVKAGDMLIIGTHTLDGEPPSTPPSVTDSLGETAVFDAGNAGADLNTWHISPVVHAGTHTITVNNFGTSNPLVNIFEMTGQASSGNPVEVIAQNFLNSGDTASVAFSTLTPNDLIYTWGRAENGSDEGDGYTAMLAGPTGEYEVAPNAGSHTATIFPRGTLPVTAIGVQALGIRAAGTTQPPSSMPRFTGNYCLSSTTTCTLNNVQADDLVFVSVYWGPGSSGDQPAITDSQGSETIVTDRRNDFDRC